MQRYWLIVVALLAAGCDRQPAAEAAVPAQQGVVDSIFPVEEEIRRFKVQVGATLPSQLQNGAHSRAELVADFGAALAQHDTARIHILAINAAEFIELYYPYTQYTGPPYRQSPALLWFLIQQNSEKGLGRALARFGGQTMATHSLQCQEHQVQELNRLWDCVVRWQTVGEAGKTDPIRLFGTILERDGRFKFLSFANDL
jgi:hypothetical protein